MCGLAFERVPMGQWPMPPLRDLVLGAHSSRLLGILFSDRHDAPFFFISLHVEVSMNSPWWFGKTRPNQMIGWFPDRRPSAFLPRQTLIMNSEPTNWHLASLGINTLKEGT